MRDKIIESAIRQIKSYGLRRFTVDDIVKDLRISKKTLYQHFSSKKELIGTVLDTAIELEKRITDEALVNGGDWFEKLDAILSVHSYTNIPYRLMDEIARFFPEERAYVDRIVEYKAKVLRELLEQVKRKDIDKDGKLAIIPKEHIKQLIGRSPDYSDALMMRLYFELKPKWVFSIY